MTASLRLQLNHLFAAYDDGEWLTAEDAAEKYDVDLSYAYKMLKTMVRDGLLEPIQVPSRKMARMVIAYHSVKVIA